MGKIHAAIDQNLQDFIERQKMFFVASAPLAAEGHVNLSPKGMDALRILDQHTIAYLDVTGSGIETVAHVKQNGRLALMFCSFDRRPLILRLHGSAQVIETGNAEFEKLRPHFPDLPGARAIIKMSVTRIADACGWGVPIFEFKESRSQYDKYAEHLGVEGLRKGQLDMNMYSIDGLPGLDAPSC